jgi:hypothetical protein
VGRWHQLVEAILLAVGLAVVTLPLVLLTLPAPDISLHPLAPDTPNRSPLDGAMLSAVVPAVLLAAVASAAVWGLLVREHPIAGGIATAVTAWAIGIVVLPIGPWLAGARFVSGTSCVGGSCSPAITWTDPLSGVKAAWIGLSLGLAYAPGVFAILVAGVAVWAWVLSRGARTREGT